nr:immunoglobulin heavy chain junction region [Macaca mulatta]
CTALTTFGGSMDVW